MRALANAPPFDARGVVGASVDDLDMLRFQLEYLPKVVSAEVLRENQREAAAQLQALRLLTPAGRPTATAVLTLGKDPQYRFPCAYIQFVRFDGAEVTDPIKDQMKIDGTLPDQLRQLDMVLKANIATALDKGGETHVKNRTIRFSRCRNSRATR